MLPLSSPDGLKKGVNFDMNIFILKNYQNIDQNQLWVIFICQKLRNATFIWYNNFCYIVTKQKSAVAYKSF